MKIEVNYQKLYEMAMDRLARETQESISLNAALSVAGERIAELEKQPQPLRVVENGGA